jgi:hypothetical protein
VARVTCVAPASTPLFRSIARRAYDPPSPGTASERAAQEGNVAPVTTATAALSDCTVIWYPDIPVDAESSRISIVPVFPGESVAGCMDTVAPSTPEITNPIIIIRIIHTGEIFMIESP